MYSQQTHAISVSVKPVYLEQESDPDQGRYFWAYHVEIENNSSMEVQLLSRYWHITDERGAVEEVRGKGVVGETPVLLPGERFAYTSGCPLSTPSGIMKGAYRMRRADGSEIDVEIPAFLA